MATSAASLPPALLRGGSLFLTALAGWLGFLVLTGHDPAIGVGARVAGVLTLLGMRVPRWVHEARLARVARHGELRRVRALVETRPLPVLARGEGAGLRDTRSLSLLAVTDLPLPVYEAAIGVPEWGEASDGDRGRRAEPSRHATADPRAAERGAIGEDPGRLAGEVARGTKAA